MNCKETINKILGIHRPTEVLRKEFVIPPLATDGLRGTVTTIDEFGTTTSTTPSSCEAWADKLLEDHKPEPIIEEWIWVEGYKGTYSDMTCKGYQYELNKQFDIEPGTTVKDCENGFHLCLKLEDVFSYYSICKDNKFFKVKALVRKKDYDTYGEYVRGNREWFGRYRDKLAARSIIFTEEVSMTELIDAGRKKFNTDTTLKDIPDRYIQLAFESNTSDAFCAYHTDILISDGYSEVFTNFLMNNMPDRFELAHALASMEDLSTDVKVMCIMDNSSDAAKRRRPR